MLDNIILQPLIRWAVPVFIMITGTLLLNPDKKMPLSKIVSYIKKAGISLLTFGYLYCVIENIITHINKENINGLFIIKMAFSSFYNLLQQLSWSHMWYMYLLIGLYVLTPILRAFIKQCSDKELKFELLFLFIFSVVIPDINNIFKTNLTTFFLQDFYYIFLFLLGYALYHKKFISSKVIHICGIIGLAGYIMLSTIGIYEGTQSGIFITLISTSVFTFVKNSKVKSNTIIKTISKDSFGIYLIHPIWINLFYKGLHIYPNILPIGIGEIVFFLGALVLSIVSVEIIKKIPFIKKII